MEVFSSADLPDVDDVLALRIVAVARSIAPCIDSLDGDAYESAVAILTGVAVEAAPLGSRRIKKQSTGPSSVEYTDSGTWFSADDRAALRGLCIASSAGGGPVGQFPLPGITTRLWPEQY